MYIRKRSFFEILLPLTVVFSICGGMHFLEVIESNNLRWLLLFFLFSYLFLNKKLLIYIDQYVVFFLLLYCVWCISTTLWSEVPTLSFSKSVIFAINAIIMISAGSLWVIKYGYKNSLNWMLLMLIVEMVSGLSGGISGIQKYDAAINLYSGLYGNANTFGFFMGILSPLIFFRLYQSKKNKYLRLIYGALLVLDVYFVLASYSRSAVIILICVLSFFIFSLPVSKKILITCLILSTISIIFLMLPASYLTSIIMERIDKSAAGLTNPSAVVALSSRTEKWQKSYAQAMKGGMIGGGFAVTIGDQEFSTKDFFRIGYGREKSNAQLAIMEETGIIGLMLYGILLISIFISIFPAYFRLQNDKKIAAGVALGAIIGLLLESVVEAWWNSAIGAEMICFWLFIGVIYGIIYTEKKEYAQRKLTL